MTPQEQIVRLTAMLQAAVQQRDAHANRCLSLEADLSVASEVVKLRDAKIGDLMKQLTPPDEEAPPAENITKLR